MPYSASSDSARPSAGLPGERVDVSVVIASHGRPRSLVRCLEALCAQTLPRGRFEVVICDDESPEPIEPLVAGFAERLTLRVVRQRHAGPAAARNEGARHAVGRHLAFTDDDCLPAPEWLELLLARCERHPGHLIGGSIVNLLPDDPYATATQLIMSCVYDYYARHPAGQRFYSTTNLTAPASRFWLLHGFSERFPRAAGEDYDFCARWHEAGFPDLYAPEVEVGHGHAHTLRSFLRQHFNYGRALFRVREGMARRRGRGGIQLESPSFYREIVLYPLRQRLGVRALEYTALVLVSQTATAVGAFWEWAIAPDPAFRHLEAPIVESDASVATTPRLSGEPRHKPRRPSPAPGATRSTRVTDASTPAGPGASP